MSLLIRLIQYQITPFDQFSFGNIFPENFSEQGLSREDSFSRWQDAYSKLTTMTLIVFLFSGAFFGLGNIKFQNFLSSKKTILLDIE